MHPAPEHALPPGTPPPAARYDAAMQQYTPARSGESGDEDGGEDGQWTSVDAITHTRSRSAFLGASRADAAGGDFSDLSVLTDMTDARARAEQRYLRAHGKTTEFRERVMQFLFRRYASWNVGENGSFMNRTSFRQCCRELELVGRTRRFVTGDIEVCFADGLLSAIEGAEGNVARRSLGHQRRGDSAALCLTTASSLWRYGA